MSDPGAAGAPDARSGGVFAVVTGGGTAGHVLPALAIADGLIARGHRADEIHYVGARRGIETRLLPPTGIPHTFLEVTGLQRRLTPANLLMPFKLARAILQAYRLLGRLRPRVAVSVGGYASLPAIVAARARRVPIVVVSYDLRPGWASKVAARFAAVCALGFDGIPLPRAVHTGSPLRRAILEVDAQRDRAAAREELGLPKDRFVLGVFGGSQGAGVLNAAISELVERWADRATIAVRHIVGERFLGGASPARGGESGILYQVIGYEDRMPQVYAAADVMLVRGGASTIAELSAIGVPAIIVPWALAAEDHQTDNAAILAGPGGAISIPEREFSADRLEAELGALIDDPERLAAMARVARECGADHRSGRLVAVIDDIGNRRPVAVRDGRQGAAGGKRHSGDTSPIASGPGQGEEPAG